MRVSKLFWVNGPEPAPIRLLNTVPLWAAGNAAKIFPAAGEILAIGIWLLTNGERPAPELGSPVKGSKTRPPPVTPPVRYSLKSQKPGVALVALVAGLQLDDARLVGTVQG